MKRRSTPSPPRVTRTVAGAWLLTPTTSTGWSQPPLGRAGLAGRAPPCAPRCRPGPERLPGWPARGPRGGRSRGSGCRARRGSGRMASAAFFCAGRHERGRAAAVAASRSGASSILWSPVEWMKGTKFECYITAPPTRPVGHGARAAESSVLETTRVPGGTFRMGSERGAAGRAARPVRGRPRVSSGSALRSPTGSTRPSSPRAVLPSRPSGGRRRSRRPTFPWWESPGSRRSAFAEWLGERLGGRWRLPSEAEWESVPFAAASTTRPRAWGEGLPRARCPEGPLDGPWPVGPRYAQRLRPARSRHGRPRVVCRPLCALSRARWRRCFALSDRRGRLTARLADAERPGLAGGRAAADRGGTASAGRRPPHAAACRPELRYADYGFRSARGGLRARSSVLLVLAPGRVTSSNLSTDSSRRSSPSPWAGPVQKHIPVRCS